MTLVMRKLVHAENPQKIYAEGAAKVVWVDYAQERPMLLPEEIRQLLGP